MRRRRYLLPFMMGVTKRFCSTGKNPIHQSDNFFFCIQQMLREDKKVAVFTDIDDTLMMTVGYKPGFPVARQSGYGSDTWFLHASNQLDKSAKEYAERHRQLLAEYFLIQRHATHMTTDDAVFNSIEHLHKKNIPVFGLTARSLSIAGPTIESLRKLGIYFSSTEDNPVNLNLPINSTYLERAVLKSGVIFCGGRPKSACLDAFANTATGEAVFGNAEKIFFIDDNDKHCNDIKNYLDQKNKQNTVFHYTRVQKKLPVATPAEIAADREKLFSVSNISPAVYAKLFHDVYGRFQKSPKHMAFLAVKQDPTRPGAIEIYQFCYQSFLKDVFVAREKSNLDSELKKICIPSVTSLVNFMAMKDSHGKIIINGYTSDCGTLLTGRPLCTINLARKNEVESSEEFVFYSMIPNRDVAQTHIQRFPPAIAEKLKKLQNYFTFCGDVEMINADVAIRSKEKRDPDQKTVKGCSARQAWIEAHSLFMRFGTPEFNRLLGNTVKILHPMTIKSREMRGETVLQEEKMLTQLNLSSLLEWLHLIGFRLSPLSFNPQQKNNLAAARAVHNTEMILVESLFNVLASHVAGSKNHLTGRFELVPLTEIIDTGEICFSTTLNDVTLTVKQTFDALVRDPEALCISDIPGFIYMVMMLLQGQPAKSVCTATVLPTEPVLVDLNLVSTVFLHTQTSPSLQTHHPQQAALLSV